MQVASSLIELMRSDQEVRAEIESPPWSIGWFIASGVSNHQQGYAIDVSLGKVIETGQKICRKHAYTSITKYEEYMMPTEIYELGTAAVSMSTPVTSQNPTAWREVEPAASMNQAALNLQLYCTSAGLTPPASEWWHFNDLGRLNIINSVWKVGFTISINYIANAE